MSHSLIGATRRTHGKIVAVALASATLLVLVGITARLAEPPGQTLTRAAVIKAGKPTLSATLDTTAVR